MVYVGLLIVLLICCIALIDNYSKIRIVKTPNQISSKPQSTPDNLQQNHEAISKIYNTDLFSISYPGYLIASQDNYLCDGSNCATPTFWFFLNTSFPSGTDSSNNFEVSRIDIYSGKDITKTTKEELPNASYVTIGTNKFLVGDNVFYPSGGKAYLIQGNGYVLRITKRFPKEEANYLGFPDLASLKLK